MPNDKSTSDVAEVPAEENADAASETVSETVAAAPITAETLSELLVHAANRVTEAAALAEYESNRASALAAFNAEWDAKRPATPSTDFMAANADAVGALASVLGFTSPQVKSSGGGRSTSFDADHARKWLTEYKASGEPMTNKYTVLGRYRSDGFSASTDPFLAILAEVKGS